MFLLTFDLITHRDLGGVSHTSNSYETFDTFEKLTEFIKNADTTTTTHKNFHAFENMVEVEIDPLETILEYRLIKTTKRLTFDIISQHDRVTWTGIESGEGYRFTASNGFEVISENRMDLDTRRVWLRGTSTDQTALRSGTKVFANNVERDHAYVEYTLAIQQWAGANGGRAVHVV